MDAFYKQLGVPDQAPYMPKDPPYLSYVYFMQALPGGNIKIGVGAYIERRLSGVQSMSPVPLMMLGSITGSVELERLLHRQFGVYRLRGEWFIPTPELLTLIKLCPDYGEYQPDYSNVSSYEQPDIWGEPAGNRRGLCPYEPPFPDIPVEWGHRSVISVKEYAQLTRTPLDSVYALVSREILETAVGPRNGSMIVVPKNKRT